MNHSVHGKKDINAADNICNFENHRLTKPGENLLRSSYNMDIIMYPIKNPTTGDVNSGITTLSSTPCQITIFRLYAYVMEAPTKAPINACEELLGIPRYHVIRSQMMAGQ